MCCSGHLFAWVKLKPAELDPAESLGVPVNRSDPNERGFSQPCPLWKGLCTIYESPHYPRACRAYKCKLLKEVLAENVALADALIVVEQAKVMIALLEAELPVSPNPNFRERLVAHIETPDAESARENAYLQFRSDADALLRYYDQHFGVNDLIQANDEAFSPEASPAVGDQLGDLE
jgi:hypothetical protein